MAKFDYRRFYERHLCRLLERGIDVHHIDHNRDNNRIENLVAIPSVLHKQYHFWHRQLSEFGDMKEPNNEDKGRYPADFPLNDFYQMDDDERLDYMDWSQSITHKANTWAKYNDVKEKYLALLKEIRIIKQSQR